ncbi:MAG: universal stress protein [Acidobacteria bacterium]|nr:universal stress protein [Acidobacteriota bacterium]
MNVQRILFPTDLTPLSFRALDDAIGLARSYGAELHVLHAVVLFADDPYNPAYHFPDVDRVFHDLRDKAETELSQILKEHHAEDLAVVRVHQRGVAAGPMILEYAEKNHIDLIVMSTHGRRGLSKVLLGSVTEEVVQLAKCPVLTLNPSCVDANKSTFERILVPVDFSDHSKKAIEVAAGLAARFGASVMLLHVIEEAVLPPFYMVGVDHLASAPELAEQTENELSRLVSLFEEAPKSASVHVTKGHPAKEIAEFARLQKADLLVIATHGLTGLEHFLLGSVTEKVVRSAPCAVLTLKAFPRS